MRIILASIFGFGISIGINLAIIFIGTMVRLFTSTQLEVNSEEIDHMHSSLQFGDYVVPMLAHFFGLLAGLLFARMICKTSSIPIFIISGLYLVGITFNLYTISHPTWFVVIDLISPLILAYLFTSKVKSH